MGKSRAKRVKRAVNTAALVPSNHPRPLQWRIDYDYVGKLSDDEQRWLANFTDAYVGGDFRKVDPAEWPAEQRSDVNRSKNASKTDAQTLNEVWGTLSELPLNAKAPVSPLPDDDYAYTNDPLYKSALAEYRSHLATGRKAKKPKPTPELEQARRKLELVRGLLDDEAEE